MDRDDHHPPQLATHKECLLAAAGQAQRAPEKNQPYRPKPPTLGAYKAPLLGPAAPKIDDMVGAAPRLRRGYGEPPSDFYRPLPKRFSGNRV